MQEQQLEWPDFVALDEARGWVSEVIGRPVELRAILREKFWGVTATFNAGDELVVFKAAVPAIFPGAPDVVAFVNRVAPGVAPALLAWADRGLQQWMVFEHIEGSRASGAGAGAAVGAAAAVADAQVAAVGHDATGLPAMPVAAVPELLTDIADVNGALVEELERHRRQLVEYAAELDELVPPSVDHVDLHLENALCAANRIVLLDWEEAVISCPLFSIDRLLVDAAPLGVADEVIEVYLNRLLPDHAVAARRRAFDLASALVPIKTAHEAREFARLHGWEYRHTTYTEACLRTAITRWEDLAR